MKSHNIEAARSRSERVVGILLAALVIVCVAYVYVNPLCVGYGARGFHLYCPPSSSSDNHITESAPIEEAGSPVQHSPSCPSCFDAQKARAAVEAYKTDLRAVYMTASTEFDVILGKIAAASAGGNTVLSYRYDLLDCSLVSDVAKCSSQWKRDLADLYEERLEEMGYVVHLMYIGMDNLLMEMTWR